ncbi:MULTISPECIES: hypothetical protein [Corallincola]|uniref:Uncharacterized protein n=2 Tax=Corallincola TaxID=1775176 RepID=A0A368N4Y6_9GAMM|nr:MULTISPECIES: hypothetical protein [Corallincola]RCU44585.1 hypothetical protein DU002_17660 [Corallincola holothuriorum]TAA40330.1 hypothetical protein EXY25_17910 [Corallincola spongiicola]
MQIDSGAVASFSSFEPNRVQQPSVPDRQQIASQEPGVAENVQESRDTARQVAVGVAEVNTQQQTIDTYVNASTSSSDDGGSSVTAADVRDAQQAATERRATIEVLDRAQNGELGNPSVNPLGQLIDTTV